MVSRELIKKLYATLSKNYDKSYYDYSIWCIVKVKVKQNLSVSSVSSCVAISSFCCKQTILSSFSFSKFSKFFSRLSLLLVISFSCSLVLSSDEVSFLISSCSLKLYSIIKCYTFEDTLDVYFEFIVIHHFILKTRAMQKKRFFFRNHKGFINEKKETGMKRVFKLY